MSSIADLRAFLMAHKLPKMTSKKSVLMEAAIERGWKPSGQVVESIADGQGPKDESVDSVPPKNSKKAGQGPKGQGPKGQGPKVAPVSKKAKAVPQKESMPTKGPFKNSPAASKKAVRRPSDE